MEIPELMTWIAEGEHLLQEFKEEITDSYKIAKTLVAFANTKGGRILVGVKDNGRIRGVDIQQELYMIDYAAQHLCLSPVEYEWSKQEYDRKEVLVIQVKESRTKPHYAMDRDGKKWAYIRVDAHVRLASLTMLKAIERKYQDSDQPIVVVYNSETERLFHILRQHPMGVTLYELVKRLAISRRRLRSLLVNLILMGVVELVPTIENDLYRLAVEDPESYCSKTTEK